LARQTALQPATAIMLTGDIISAAEVFCGAFSSAAGQ
jgi:hypothetical protein